MSQPQPSQVVVGVDGSAESERALHWAAQYGHDTAIPVHVIAIWHLPAQFGYHVTASDDQLASHAEGWLKDAVAQARHGCPNATITTHTERGHPVTVLVDHSHAAKLLVLGNKRQGAATATILGSVAPEVLHHADCPVVVVP